MKKRRFKNLFVTVVTFVMITCGTFAAMTTFAYADTDLPEVEEIVNETAGNEIETENKNDTIETEIVSEIENDEEIIVNEEVQVETAEMTEIESSYGVATGNEGSGNESGNVVWKEYEKDGEYTMVFTVNDASASEEDCAITKQFGGTEYASRVNRIVLEEGISGAGWTYLYDKSGYYPLYPQEGYIVDRSKTDNFYCFKALTEVVPCSTLKRIGWSAFNGCTSLARFDFTACPNLQEVMNQAFYRTKSFETVDLSNCNSLTLLAWSSFNNAGNGKTAVMILPADENLTVIGGHALDGWKNVIRAEVKPLEEEIPAETPVIEEEAAVDDNKSEEPTDIVIVYVPENTEIQESIDETKAQETAESVDSPAAVQETAKSVDSPAAVQETAENVDSPAAVQETMEVVNVPLAVPVITNTGVQEVLGTAPISADAKETIEDAETPLAAPSMMKDTAQDSIADAAIPMAASSVADPSIPVAAFIIGAVFFLALAAIIFVKRRKEQE